MGKMKSKRRSRRKSKTVRQAAGVAGRAQQQKVQAHREAAM